MVNAVVGVAENKGTANINDNGEFTITFESPVATTLYAFVTFEDDFGNEYSFEVPINKGSDTASYDISSLSTTAPFTIKDIKLGFKEDGSDSGETAKDKKYEYSTSYGGGSDVDGKTFVMSILCTETDNLTPEDYQAIIDAQGQGFDYIDSYDEIDFGGVDTAQAMFVINCQVVPADMEIWKDDREERYFEEHSHDFVFLTQKSISEIKEDFTTDTEYWVMEHITMNGKTYEKWIRRDLSGAQCPYSIEGEPMGDDRELTYTLKIKK